MSAARLLELGNTVVGTVDTVNTVGTVEVVGVSLGDAIERIFPLHAGLLDGDAHSLVSSMLRDVLSGGETGGGRGEGSGVFVVSVGHDDRHPLSHVGLTTHGNSNNNSNNSNNSSSSIDSSSHRQLVVLVQRPDGSGGLRSVLCFGGDGGRVPPPPLLPRGVSELFGRLVQVRLSLYNY